MQASTGWITNPKKAADNRVYNRTTRRCLVLVIATAGGLTAGGVLLNPVLRL